MERFAHEKLIAYQVAEEFYALAGEVLRGVPRWSDVVAQMEDAAGSAMHNIAEAAGRPPGKEKAKFFGYARGSAEECAAALRRLEIRGWVAPEAAARGRALLHREVRLLAGLARSALARAAGAT